MECMKKENIHIQSCCNISQNFKGISHVFLHSLLFMEIPLKKFVSHRTSFIYTSHDLKQLTFLLKWYQKRWKPERIIIFLIFCHYFTIFRIVLQNGFNERNINGVVRVHIIVNKYTSCYHEYFLWILKHYLF